MSTKNLYVGRSGQMAVMAEFLWRGWNVAIPEVDIGDDLFVVQDEEAHLYRIQVKTATGKELKRGGYVAQFRVRLDQLRSARTPEPYYVLASRWEGNWDSFLVIRQDELRDLYELKGVGSLYKGHLTYRFTYRNLAVHAKDLDLSNYLGNWDRWPTQFD